jgi:6-phosphofructokinase 2
MIFTVTLNPALDRTLLVDRLLDDDTTRVVSEQLYAGGKGIDVSRVIKALGGQTIALGLVGGYDGLQLEGLLINAGVMTDFTRIAQETRINLIIKERGSGRQYVISAAGPEATATEIGLFYQRITQLQGASHLVISGSLPRGVTPNVYAQTILAGKKKGAFVMLDADGDALKGALDAGPACIKPNRHELSRLVGKELQSDADVLSACDEIHALGIPYVLASLGGDGLILSTRERKIKAAGPTVQVESTVGSGDSAVAGFVLAHARGECLEDCARMAAASGTATARTPGTELCTHKDVDEILPLVKVNVLA